MVQLNGLPAALVSFCSVADAESPPVNLFCPPPTPCAEVPLDENPVPVFFQLYGKLLPLLEEASIDIVTESVAGRTLFITIM